MSPVIIQVTLLSGRYHAHPWGEAQHAMAGPEWPPSPWRLLRTIAACWFDTAEPPCSTEQRDRLLEKLGRSDSPRIWIPSASFSELPFYQPLTKEVQRTVGGTKISLREVNSRALHFDHFAVLAASNVYFVFGGDLDEEERTLLSKILAAACYFGRAESRASLCLAGGNVQKPDGYYEARPARENGRHDDTVHRSVLVTTTDFKAVDLWQVRQAAKGKARSKAQPTSGDYPTHLVEALIGARKAIPDGTAWVHYAVPRAAILHELPRKAVRAAPPRIRPAAEVIFRLFRRVPIPVGDTVRLARDFRDQAVRSYKHATDHDAILLSGREQDGSISRGHLHAYYLPQPSRAGGSLERMVVELPGGENGVQQEIIDALLGVTRLWRRDRYPVLVVAEYIRPAPATPAVASIWRSLTPFLGPLHHRRSRDCTEPRQQLLSTLMSAVGIDPSRIESWIVPALSHLYSNSNDGSSRHYRFVRRAGTCFTLEFPQPVQLPAAVGADAHFGLGQFEPAIGGP